MRAHELSAPVCRSVRRWCVSVAACVGRGCAQASTRKYVVLGVCMLALLTRLTRHAGASQPLGLLQGCTVKWVACGRAPCASYTPHHSLGLVCAAALHCHAASRVVELPALPRLVVAGGPFLHRLSPEAACACVSVCVACACSSHL
jgi:hypothetical protein